MYLYIYIFICVCAFVPGQHVDLFCCFLIKWLRCLRLMFMMSCISSLLGELSQNPCLMTFMSFVFWEITTVFGWYVTQICLLFDDVLPCFTHVLLPKAWCLPVRVLSGVQDKDADAREAAFSWLGNNPNISQLWKDHEYTYIYIYEYIWYVYYPTSTIIQL